MGRSVRWSFVIAGVLIGVLVATAFVIIDRPVAGTPVVAGATETESAPATQCDARTPLTVVAPPVLAEAVRLAAEPLCLDADVRAVGGRAGVVASREPGVDVWITDSRLWSMARGGVDPAAGVSVASSPVVMAVGTGLADTVGTPEQGVSWGLPLKRQEMPQLGIAVQDPVGTAVGLLATQGVLTVAQAVVPDEFTALSATAAAFQRARVAEGPALGTVGPTEVLFVAEYAIGTVTGAQVFRGREGEPTLDFPAFVVTADEARRTAATDLVTTLSSPAANQVRAAVSLRDPDGGAQFAPTTAEPVGAWMPTPDPKTALRMFGLAQSGSTPSRSLVSVDVSGSMIARQPNGETLMDVVRRSALVALSALPDHSAFGLWEFSSEIEGPQDHRVLMPITRLAEGRPATADAVRRLNVVPDGATGLYDTVLAQYRELQAGYDPNAQQYLVVLTDGKNENDRGLDLDGLLAELRALQDPARPISLVAIGYGAVDVALLQRIADVIGGSVYSVRAAEQIVGVLIDAIGRAHTTV